MQEDKLIRCLSISLSFRLLQTTVFPIIGICKLFSCNAKQHMLFWLLKDAWLTCNWCSVRALPTPFWSPIKHLLKLAWQPIDLLLVADLFFCTYFLYLQMIYLKLCNDFSKSYLYSQRMKMKRSLYRRMRPWSLRGRGADRGKCVQTPTPWRISQWWYRCSGSSVSSTLLTSVISSDNASLQVVTDDVGSVSFRSFPSIGQHFDYRFHVLGNDSCAPLQVVYVVSVKILGKTLPGCHAQCGKDAGLPCRPLWKKFRCWCPFIDSLP